MANCEYRVGKDEAADNLISNLDFSFSRRKENQRPQGTIAACLGSDLCQAKINQLLNNPVCDLPNMPTKSCPIAQWQKGEIDMPTANEQLEKLLGQE
jgi:hypothetical protein